MKFEDIYFKLIYWILIKEKIYGMELGPKSNLIYLFIFL